MPQRETRTKRYTVTLDVAVTYYPKSFTKSEIDKMLREDVKERIRLSLPLQHKGWHTEVLTINEKEQ